MATDDDRRRVAERLREYASWDEEGCLTDCAEWGESVLDLLNCGDTDRETYAALADLIDPGDTSPSCRDTVACDREALLALVEEAEKSAWYFALDHGEDELRDRLTEAAEEFSDMARRIREACGEVVV